MLLLEDKQLKTLLESIKRSEKSRKKINFKYKSNNWLKMHGQVKRRKPFFREGRPRILWDDEAWKFNQGLKAIENSHNVPIGEPIRFVRINQSISALKEKYSKHMF